VAYGTGEWKLQGVGRGDRDEDAAGLRLKDKDCCTFMLSDLGLKISQKDNHVENISTKTSQEDYKEWLLELGYDCEEREGYNGIRITKNGLRVYMAKTRHDNVVFLINFQTKDGLEREFILNKINEINRTSMSGCLSYTDGVVQFGFSLIKPYGMGQKGFSNFLEYNIVLIGFLIEEMGLSEIIK
jgi:hypothetical protein